MKALVLVAHPDDETIFAGALMLTNPEWDWTVVCATHEEQSERGQEFFRAISAFQGEGVNIVRAAMLGLEDSGPVLNLPTYIEWERSIASAGVAPEAVFTHNRRGDYGHGHHMSVNAAAHVLYPEAQVWEFYYPRMTGVGRQARGSQVIHPVHTGKRRVFRAAYEQHLETLLYHLPELMTYHVLDGQEMHTCGFS